MVLMTNSTITFVIPLEVMTVMKERSINVKILQDYLQRDLMMNIKMIPLILPMIIIIIVCLNLMIRTTIINWNRIVSIQMIMMMTVVLLILLL
ncbi:hypothetical protein U3516DRAFT_890695 [Neocallimastix sp. 'constans']